MSKKAKKSPAPRKAEQNRSKTAVAGRAVSRSGPARRQSGRAEPVINLQAARITAAVLGVIVLAGAIVMMIQLNGAYTTEAIVTVVLLGFIVGLSAFAAVRISDFVDFFARLGR
jgi:hypothetical protein